MTSVPRAQEQTAVAAAAVTPSQDVAPAQSPARPIAYRTLLLFYLPLGFSGLMMLLDLPVVNAVLNRFPNPDVSVAALRVAFSMALVYEASHIAMIDVSTALSIDARTFAMLRRFYVIMAGVLLVLASLVAFSPLYDWLVRDVMNISAPVADAARPAVWAFLLWPLPIGWRRLYQGALIRHGHPKVVGAGALVRLGSLVAALAFFSWVGTAITPIEPAAIAVLAMLVSVTAEAAAVQGWTGRVLKEMPKETPNMPPPTYGHIWRFFFPLAGTAVLSTLTNPVLTAGIASAALLWMSPGGSTVAVASYAIAWSMGFLFFGPALSMTQASIAWSKSPDPSVRVRGPRLLLGVGVVLAALMALATLTPFAYWIFSGPLDTPPATAALAVQVAILLIPMPILHSASFILRGKLIAAGRPKAVRLAQMVDLVALVVIIQIATSPQLSSLFMGAPAAPLAAIAYNLVLVVDIVVLLVVLRWGRGRR